MTNETNKIDVSGMNEQALEGVNHLLSKENWTQLLGLRMKDITNLQPLSTEFIINHKNDLGFRYLAMFGSLMVDDKTYGKDYNLDFFHRFWRFSDFDGGNSVALMYALNKPDKTDTFEKNILCHQCRQNTSISMNDENPDTTLPTFQDYEKNPYFYDAGQLSSMVLFRSDVPADFADRFIHLFPFADFFTNLRVPKKVKKQFVERFGVVLGDKRWLFPDGTVVAGNTYGSVDDGDSFYDNLLQYKTEDENAIRTIIAKFPRAINDCLDPENALAMKAK